MTTRRAIVSMEDLLGRIADILSPYIGAVAEVEDHRNIVEAGLEYFCWGKLPRLDRLVGCPLPTETSRGLFDLILAEIQRDAVACFGAIWPARVYNYDIVGNDIILIEVQVLVHQNLWGEEEDE